MSKKRNKLIDNPVVQLILVIILSFFIMGLLLILYKDLELDKSFVVYCLLGVLSIVGLIFSYNLAYKKVYNYLYFGITRKEFFYKFLYNLLISFAILLFLIVFYMFGYMFIYEPTTSILDIFQIQNFIFLLVMFVIFSSFGFMFGILKIKRWLFYIISSLIILTTAFIIYQGYIKYYYNIAISLVAICLVIADYYLMKYLKI